MGGDSFTEVSSQSWFSRLGGALKGVLFGVVLLVVATVVLFWNEGRAVKRYKTLKEGGGAVISINADAVDGSYEGKLVHLSGTAATDEVLVDNDFGIQINAIQLRRQSQMYQWQESRSSKTEKKLGGGEETVTTYSYSKGWSSTLINSARFKKPENHQNPTVMPYASRQQTANDVRLGAFHLSRSQVGSLADYRPLPAGEHVTLSEQMQQTMTIQDQEIYMGSTPGDPQIGDVIIRFSMVGPTEISLVARQSGRSFQPYLTEAGGRIDLLQMGTTSAAAMFQAAQESNTFLTWLIRAGGLVGMFIGFSLIIGPLAIFADVIPLLGSIVGAGTALIAGLLAGTSTLCIVAIAWLVYRPLIGGAFLLCAAAIIWLIIVKVKKADPVKPPPIATPPPLS